MVRRSSSRVLVGALVLPLLLIGLIAGRGPSAVLAAGAATPPAGAAYNPVITPDAFVRQIDNRYLPLRPGTTFIYEGTKEGQTERNEVTVTADTKLILGVACVVVRDRVTVDGELAEDTLDWYAQDKDGNVWYFGEAAKAYEQGKLVDTKGSWEAGVDGAKPGIAMPAQPHVGVSYRQEYLPGVAEDVAEVRDVAGKVTVPYGSFRDVLVTRESTALEPSVIEEKSYAPGVGLVLSVALRGESERLDLVAVQRAPGGTPAATPGV